MYEVTERLTEQCLCSLVGDSKLETWPAWSSVFFTYLEDDLFRLAIDDGTD